MSTDEKRDKIVELIYECIEVDFDAELTIDADKLAELIDALYHRDCNKCIEVEFYMELQHCEHPECKWYYHDEENDYYEEATE